ncbi:MAG: aminopeptidase P family protein [Candidatus Omnitrophica bacterium]|nr:aminopeptidase P family protein [Candidatus Omnitrophota bacterium]
MLTRISRLRASFPQLKINALLVTDDINIRYLIGFPAADSWLLVTQRKAFYVTDFRYTLEARKGLPERIEVVQAKGTLLEAVIDLAKKEKVRHLGLDEWHVTLQQFRRLKTLAGRSLGFKPADNVIEALRSVKSPDEIALIRKAIKINLAGFRYIQRFIKPGVTEKVLLYKLEDFIRSQGVGFAFSPIIASGPNSALPHAQVTERKLRQGEPLLIDLGIRLNGYNSDLTRMFFLGRMPTSLGKVLSLIKASQREAVKVIRPGVAAKAVDAASRSFLEKHGLARHFGHSLGHGVGMDVHEGPRLSEKSGAILQENMVVTIEPGVYFPGKYGVRQEEMVLVTKTGCEVLSDHN